MPEQYVELSAADAERYGLEDGERVRVVTRRSSYEARISVGITSIVHPARNEVPDGYLFSPWNLSVADSADPEEEPLARQRRQSPRLGSRLRPGRLQEARGADRADLAARPKPDHGRSTDSSPFPRATRLRSPDRHRRRRWRLARGHGWRRRGSGVLAPTRRAVGRGLPRYLHPLRALCRRLSEPRHRRVHRGLRPRGRPAPGRRAARHTGHLSAAPGLHPLQRAPGDTLLCTEACPSGALQLTKKDARHHPRQASRWGRPRSTRNICYSFNGASCGACVRACPFEGVALSSGLWEKPIIDPDKCVGCGLCERSCVHYPQAIRVVPNLERT